MLGTISQPFVYNDWSLGAGQEQQVWGEGEVVKSSVRSTIAVS